MIPRALRGKGGCLEIKSGLWLVGAFGPFACEQGESEICRIPSLLPYFLHHILRDLSACPSIYAHQRLHALS